MENNIIHRKAKFRYGLCGAPTDVENSTLDDAKVTCVKCMEILSEVSGFNENSKARAERRNKDAG